MEFYEEFAGQYDNLVSFKNRKRREIHFWKKLWAENDVKSILDCSCGTGHHLMIFAQMGLQVQGSDLSAAMCKKPENIYKRNTEIASAISGDS